MCVCADACIGKVAALTLVGQVKDSLSPLSVMIFGNRKDGLRSLGDRSFPLKPTVTFGVPKSSGLW
jgi:hypothetical protein